MPEYQTGKDLRISQKDKVRYQRRTKSISYSLVVVGLSFLFQLIFFRGCGPSAQKSPSADLDSVTSYGTVTSSTITGINISLPSDNYYVIHLRGTLGFSRSDSAESVYVPLLVSKSPVRFPQQLSFHATVIRPDLMDDADTARAITADVISVESKTGSYYYIAGLLKADLDSLAFRRDDPPNFSIDVQFDAYSPEQNSKICVPLGNQLQQTTIELSMDRKSHLSDANLTAAAQSLELTELPGEISQGYRKYTYSGSFQGKTFLGTDLGLTTPLPMIRYFWIVLLVALLAVLAGLVTEFILGRKFQQKLLALMDKMDFHWPQYGDDHELAKFTTKLNVIRSLESRYARSRFKNWIIPVVMGIIFLLLFLLISLSSSAQHPRTVIKNLSIEIRPDHSLRDTFRLTAYFQYEVYSSRPLSQSPESFHFAFAGEENRIDFSRVTYDPLSLNCKDTPRFYNKNICILNGDYSSIRQPLLDILTNPHANKDLVDGADRRLTGANPCLVTVPFLRYTVQKNDYVYPSLLGYHFHRFPYDEEIVTIPLTLGQFTVLKEVNVYKDEAFIGQPQINIDEWDTKEEADRTILSGEKPEQVRAQQQILVTIHFKRSWTKRVMVPVLLVLAILINVLAWRTQANFLVKLATGLAAQGGLATLYKLVIEKSNKIPNFLETNDVVSWCDVIFGIGILAVIICSFHMPEKQKP